MAENMLDRSKVHVAKIQRKGVLDLFADTRQDLEGNFVCDDEVQAKIHELLNQYEDKVILQQFIADFYTVNGALCKVKDLKDLLLEMEKNGNIIIKRFENDKITDKHFMTTRGYTQKVFLSREKS